MAIARLPRGVRRTPGGMVVSSQRPKSGLRDFPGVVYESWTILKGLVCGLFFGARGGVVLLFLPGGRRVCDTLFLLVIGPRYPLFKFASFIGLGSLSN